jgi:hypothetical protein
MESEEKWRVWFKNYKDLILHFAKIAQKYKVEMFCIGTELSGTQKMDKEWREVIKEVRKVYSGKLTYAANFFDYVKVSFWDELDYAGIDAYFPLMSKKANVKSLLKKWKVYLKKIEEWQKEINKPVIFTEIGYRPIEGARFSPWDWKTKGKLNLLEQKILYESAFKTFFKKKWFYGFYWWMWMPSDKAGGKKDKDYTPYKKPAEEVLKKWYKKKTR